jgi:NDP-sugar pyrophosphorylase family protein
MKRALILTSAGMSTRFSRSVGKDVLKVLYSEDSPKECLLADQLSLADKFGFDRIIVVGGYSFEELKSFIARYFQGVSNIETVYNEKYREYGTCYSFVRGLKALRDQNIDEIVFMEGDLIFDEPSFSALVDSPQDVITANRRLIRAGTSVIFYTTTKGRLRYLYDTRHAELRIAEPFTFLGNSGQVWKFCDVPLLHRISEDLGTGLFDDTNLLPLEKYFNARGLCNVTYITFDVWINCNTIDDYRAVRDLRRSLEKHKR